jgi:Tol biopolymer transport system component
MGEVYRARDTKLDRDVALKILPEAFTNDADRLARFRREAQVLASLNHPNIAAIYGFEDSESTRALVMELVEGADLSALIARRSPDDGRVSAGLPPAEALSIARQIAEALDAAHERGIVHRDLKPANIKVTGDGTVKVLDFGLAKALGREAEAESAATATMTSPTLTQAGVILGTASYMSPEQARGKPVDKRTDIWSYGVVLYEMLTGRSAFPGETVADVIAAIVHKEPDLTALPPGVPVRVRALIERCLEKDPRARWRDIGDAKRELTGDADVRSPAGKARQWSGLTTIVAAVAAVAGAAALWQTWAPSAPAGNQTAARSEARFRVLPPADSTFVNLRPSISDDGRKLAFIAASKDRRRIYLRDMASMETSAVPGTEGAGAVRLSADGSWLAFRAGERLLRLTLTGQQEPIPVSGAPRLAPVMGGALVASAATATFDLADDGSFLLVADLADGLLQIGQSGGVRMIRRLNRDAGELAIAYPTALPGSQSVLFGILTQKGWKLMGRTLDGSRERVVVDGATVGEFAQPDLLVYSLDRGLYATRFDPHTLATSGSPVTIDNPLPNEVMAQSRAVFFSLSSTGVLAHMAGPVLPEAGSLAIVDRATGRESPLREPGSRPRFVPPAGDRLVAEESAQVWIHDVASGGRTRLTNGDGLHYNVVPSPDGSRIVMSTYDGGAAQLSTQSLSSAEPARRLLPEWRRRRYPSSFAPDGRLAVLEYSEVTNSDILIIRPDGTEQVWLKTKYVERLPRFSPDGRWLAYVSDESGRFEVFVKDVAARLRAVNVSIDGGDVPVWDPSGRELFFLRGEEIFVVAIQTGATVTGGRPRLVRAMPGLEAPDVPYDISPDGRRFVVARRSLKPPDELRIVIGLDPR